MKSKFFVVIAALAISIVSYSIAKADEGCTDPDGDGFCTEVNDMCANDYGTLAGCPDTDGDGVADLFDQCADVAGSPENHGCPNFRIVAAAIHEHISAIKPISPVNNDPVVIRPLDPKLIDRLGAIHNFFKDSDGDGVTNMFDKCPDDKGPAETEGCPDADGDGIWGSADLCPDQAAPGTSDGCLVDSDDDGIADDIDNCPDQAAPETSDGCPIDSDDDGIADDVDNCPDEAAPETSDGCPADTNKDIDNTNALDAFGDGCTLVHNAGTSLNGIVSMLVFAASIVPIAIRRRKSR